MCFYMIKINVFGLTYTDNYGKRDVETFYGGNPREIGIRDIPSDREESESSGNDSEEAVERVSESGFRDI